MKKIKLQFERFELTIIFSASVEEYCPIGFEPHIVHEIDEIIEYEFNIKSMNKIFSTKYLFFDELINYVTPGEWHYSEMVANANKGLPTKGQYICNVNNCLIRVDENEKNEILKAISELKESEYKEQNLYEIKKEQVIEEVKKKISSKEEYIAKCEEDLKKGEKLMTDSEIKEYVIKWNNLYNEGHQDPLPFRILSKENYEHCIKTLKALNEQLDQFMKGDIFK